MGLLVDCSLGEPEFEFVGGGFGVGATVYEVIFDGQGHVTADGTGLGFNGIGGAHHHSDGFGGVGAGYCEGDDGAADEIVDNIVKKWSIFVFGVMGFDGLAGGIHELETRYPKAAEFDSADDFSVEVAGDSAGLDENQCCFHIVLRLPGGWFGFGALIPGDCNPGVQPE